MYQLRFKFEGIWYQRISEPKYKNIDLRALFEDFVFSRTLGGIIPLEEAKLICDKSIAGSNYKWL